MVGRERTKPSFGNGIFQLIRFLGLSLSHQYVRQIVGSFQCVVVLGPKRSPHGLNQIAKQLFSFWVAARAIKVIPSSSTSPRVSRCSAPSTRRMVSTLS